MLEDFSHDDEWTTDTRASTHMTGSPGMLKKLRRYLGNDVVIVGVDNSHTSTHIGHTYIDNGTNKIKLRDVLLVPALAKKLLSIGKLTTN